jgi:O-antigen polymerase
MPPLFKMSLKLSSEKILIIILSFIFLFLMHLFLPNIGGVIARQNEQIIWLFSGAIIFIGALRVLFRKTLIESPLQIYILLFISLWLFSLLFNPIKNIDNFFINSIFLLSSLLLWMAFLQFELTEKQKLLILFFIFISSIIESLIGIIQFFGLYKYIPVTPSPEVGMVGGVFQQKNTFASYIATGIIISLFFIQEDLLIGFSKIKKILFFPGIFLLSLSLIIAESRTGLLGVTFGLILMFIIRRKNLLEIKKKALIWLMVFLTGISSGFFLLSIRDQLGIEKLMAKKLRWFSDPEQVSYKERILMQRASLEMFKEKPFTGHGFSNFGSLYMYYQAKIKNSNPSYRGTGLSYTHHPHNEISLIIAEAGLLGISGLFILFYGFFKFFTKTGFEHAGTYIALLSPFLIHSLFEYPLRLSVAHWFTFIILFYLATSNLVKKTELKISPKLTQILTTAGCALFILFSVFIVKTFIAYNQLVIWYIEYTEKKKADLINLEPASQNFYLKNWAKPMYMFTKAEEAVKDIEKNKDFLFEFLNWAQAEKKRLPIPQVFQYDAYVLLNLGMHFQKWDYFDEAMRTVEEGLFIYPENKELKELRIKIFREAFKLVLKNFEKKNNIKLSNHKNKIA